MQQHECAMSWKAHCGEVCSVEFSCDENAVYSIGEDGKVGAAGLRAGAPLPPAGLSEFKSWAGFKSWPCHLLALTLGLSLPQRCHR